MKKLYSVTYTTVIYDTPEKISHTASRLHAATLAVDSDSIKEIRCAENLPKGWEISFYPVTSDEGSLGNLTIEALLDNMSTQLLKEENRFLKETLVKEYERGYEAGLDAAYHSAQYRKD